MNTNKFLEDVSAGVMRVMLASRQENALITYKNKDKSLKSFMAVMYFDNPEYNQRVLDAMVAEAQKIDQEREVMQDAQKE